MVQDPWKGCMANGIIDKIFLREGENHWTSACQRGEKCGYVMLVK